MMVIAVDVKWNTSKVQDPKFSVTSVGVTASKLFAKKKC
jgi:hypothetical protein